MFNHDTETHWMDGAAMLDDAVAGESAVSRAPFVLHVVCSARHLPSRKNCDVTSLRTGTTTSPGGAGVTVLFRDVDAPDSDAA